uniref:Uncharacterized protein n=1 Tax=Timema monikensis TaxID=170555 RepID=A0A7R9EHZ4_9NEOP|nr:unnamed protein product [Timema monikensis]
MIDESFPDDTTAGTRREISQNIGIRDGNDELVKFIYELGKYSQEQDIDCLNLICIIDDECCLRIKTMTTGEVLKTLDAWIYCGTERLIDHRVIEEMDDTSSLFTFLEDQQDGVAVTFQVLPPKRQHGRDHFGHVNLRPFRKSLYKPRVRHRCVCCD